MTISGSFFQGNALNSQIPSDISMHSFSNFIYRLEFSIRHVSISRELSSRELIHPTLQAERCISSSGELINLNDRESSVADFSDDMSNQNIFNFYH